MTRKEALAALQLGLRAAFSVSLHTDLERNEERWKLYGEMLAALRVLTPSALGKVPYGCWPLLCHTCYMNYQSWKVGDTCYADNLCQPCREAQAKQQEAQASQTSEVSV